MPAYAKPGIALLAGLVLVAAWTIDHTLFIVLWVILTVILMAWIVVVTLVGMFRELTGTSEDQRRWAWCCLNCGYDLRGNVSGVCPECGTPTVRKPLA